MTAAYGDGSIFLGYDGVPDGFRTSPAQVLWMHAEPIRRPLYTFRDEMIAAAKAMGDKFQGEQIHVLYSGGFDSESVLHAMRLAGVPCKAVILCDTGGLNWTELGYARAYVDASALTDYDLVSFDFMDWMQSDAAKEIGANVQAGNSTLVIPFKTMLDTYPDKVFTSGVYVPEFSYAHDVWNLHEYEGYYANTKFFLRYGFRGLPGFFHANTELYHSHLTDSVWRERYRDGVVGVSSDFNSAVKSLFYNKHFGLAPREVIKWMREPSVQAWNPDGAPFNQHWVFPLRHWLRHHQSTFM